MYRAFVVYATLALSACLDVDVSNGSGGGSRAGDGGGSPICQVVGDGNNYSGTTYDNPGLAFDGSLATFATLSPASSAGGTISGGGIDRMAGEVPGVAFTRPGGGTVSVSITTYKDNVPGNTSEAGTWTFTSTGEVQSCPGGAANCFERDGLVFFGIETLTDFDRIEASITIANLPAPLELRELCVR